MGWRDSWAWHMACKAYILTRVKMLLLGACGIYEKYFSAYWFSPISTNSSLLFLCFFWGGVQCTRFFLSLLISWSDLPIPPIPICLPAPLSSPLLKSENTTLYLTTPAVPQNKTRFLVWLQARHATNGLDEEKKIICTLCTKCCRRFADTISFMNISSRVSYKTAGNIYSDLDRNPHLILAAHT